MIKKIIWLIDDDPIYQTIMKKIIDKSGVSSHVVSYTNGKDAIQALEEIITNNEQLPNLILLDIEMPVLDGWGFMTEMSLLKQKIKKEIKIYISSSSIAIEDKQKAKNNPDILGYISKPVTITDIVLIASDE